MLPPCRIIPLLLILWVAPWPARACNIPVFRYALERWRPDLYQVILFHQGPLSAKENALLKPFQPEDDKPGPLNGALELVDVSQELKESTAKLWQAQGKPPLPWLVVRYPGKDNPAQAWTGPLTAESVRSLTESPARKDLGRRLLEGNAVVWVVLESGQKEKDEAAREQLARELPRLQRLLKIPPQTPQDTVPLLSNLPLAISFSVQQVSRQDQAEKVFVDLLLGTVPELATVKDPVVFPVFGRGRVLTGLAGKDLQAEVLRDVGTFLCGACSCQVKEMNPGKDLLLAVDWESLYKEKPPPKPEPKEATIGELVPIPRGKSDTEAAGSSEKISANPAMEPKNRGRRQALLIAGIVIGLIVLGSGIYSLRSKTRRFLSNDATTT